MVKQSVRVQFQCGGVLGQWPQYAHPGATFNLVCHLGMYSVGGGEEGRGENREMKGVYVGELED